MATHQHQHPRLQAPRQQHRVVVPDTTTTPTPNSRVLLPSPTLGYDGANTYEPMVYNTSNSAVIYDDPAPLSLYPGALKITRQDSTGWSDAGLGPLAIGVGAAHVGGVVGNPDKFPGGIEVGPGFSTYSENPGVYMPSTASSVTGLSTLSRTSSVGSVSVCSPTVTEPSEPHNGFTSRFPSPLRKSTTPECVMPGDDTPQGRRNAHICLWGSNGVCESGGFATRAELNRHVKMDHLLECPVPGCTETVFETRDLLACHVKWDHNNNNDSPKTGICRSANLLGGGLTSQHDVPNEFSSDSTPVAKKTNAAEDRVLKMEMSIGISKRRCREQLRTVLEKRLRRTIGKS